MLDQSNTQWLVGGKGNQGSVTFFYRHFLFLGNQEQVFLFSLLISKLIHALYLNAHFNTTQGTKCRIFFSQPLRLDPIDSGSPVTYLASFK